MHTSLYMESEAQMPLFSHPPQPSTFWVILHFQTAEMSVFLLKNPETFQFIFSKLYFIPLNNMLKFFTEIHLLSQF